MRKVFFIILALSFTFAYSQDKYELKSQDGTIYCESGYIKENTLDFICEKYGVVQFDDSPTTPYFFFQIVSSWSDFSLESMYNKEYEVTLETDKNETITFRAKIEGLTNIIGTNVRMYFGEKSFKNGAKEIAKIFRGNVTHLSLKGDDDFHFRMKTKETLPQMINSIEEKSGKRFSSDFKRNVGLLAGASSSQGTNTPSSNTSNSQNEHQWVDLGLPSKTKWASTNIGASKPSDYGSYFAWAETETKNIYLDKTLKYCIEPFSVNYHPKYSKYVTNKEDGIVDSKRELDLNDDAAYINWGKNWRMPSKEQLLELHQKCKWSWTSIDGHPGYKVIGPNGNYIFLPASGYRNNNEIGNRGSACDYWSRTLCTSPSNSYVVTISISIYNGEAGRVVGSSNRGLGHVIRPVYIGR